MLKRLELVGFKSFADKTEFAFGPGVTAVVGPNGSGKSNVVDAVRWIMGEQSPKSLRGGEMTDVIFNGSATRKPLGMAEVSLTLDNSRRLLAVDAEEVQIARRVYRDGRGEYLINRQPARLKDIKELFLGSGAGTDAYCIIAQGRVDSLLHASNQERRAVFEEAAGISRFRAKKQETLRKLEQTEQNLARLQDIVDELNRQLQNVRQQASKALKFQELNAALMERRIALGLQECRGHAEALKQLEAESAAAQFEEAEEARAAETADRLAEELEGQLRRCETLLREREAALADLKASQAAAESHHQHEAKRAQALAEELSQSDDRRAELITQAAAGAQLEAAAENEAAGAAGLAERLASAAAEALERLLQRNAEIKLCRDRAEGHKASLLDDMRQAARSHNDVVSLKAHAQNLDQHHGRLAARRRQAEEALTQLRQELTATAAAESAAADTHAAASAALADLRRQIESEKQRCIAARAALAADREASSGVASQLALLRDLEANRDGSDAAVRDLLEQAKKEPEGPWGGLKGAVGDFLTVDPEHAALFDMFLGDRADWLLIPSLDSARTISLRSPALTGRVTFLPCGPLADAARATPNFGLPPDCACAAGYVSCDAPFGPALLQFLFGDLILVRDLAQALELRSAHPTKDFLTCAGELLTAEGALTLGPPAAGMGRLARKSRVAELEAEAARLEAQLALAAAEAEAAAGQLASLEAEEPALAQAAHAAGERHADMRFRLAQQREREAALAEDHRLSGSELLQLEDELATLRRTLTEAEDKAAEADEQVRRRQAAIAAAEAELAALEQERGEQQEGVTSAKVAAAQAEERRSAAEAKLRQAAAERLRREEELEKHHRRAAALAAEQADAAAQLSRLAAELAAAQAARSALEAEVRTGVEAVATMREERRTQEERRQAQRERLAARQQRRHALEMKKNERQLQLASLAARALEEHETDLLALLPSYQPPAAPLDAGAVNAEIAELKKKLARLGSVNLDALAELTELEARAASLQRQHADLAEAKQSLEEIIEKINGDSRRLFAATYESVRRHFQDIFRKLFGGGTADVLLENPDDVLESGIEIVARPPGKEARNLSLLSGGEKSLTAVALLLAIFRDKPSPFCIMDEVDAALDEANVGRFAATLRDFLDRSQFILISHSKKTMAAADVLYGVTMQEAGVSKRIAVRLEDSAAASAKAA